jgi:hypothetical protein
MATASNTELRCLSDAELNAVSGGNPLVAGAAGFFLAWAGTKLLDALGSDEPMTGPMKVILDEFNKPRPK